MPVYNDVNLFNEVLENVSLVAQVYVHNFTNIMALCVLEEASMVRSLLTLY